MDLFNLDTKETLSTFDQKKNTIKGLFKPNPEDGDKTNGYSAILRFLPNFTRDEQVGPSAIEKLTHYIKLESHPDLEGPLECNKNTDDNCPICNTYWKLKNSKSASDNEKAKAISRTVNYYSYVYVVDDSHTPDNIGKIMILQYGVKIANKINDEKKMLNVTKSECNIFDLAEGKDFSFSVRKVAGFNNYDSCKFLDSKSPIKIKGKVMPTEEDDNGKTVISHKVRDAVKKFLLSRDVELEDFKPKAWTETEHEKAKAIVEVISGVSTSYSSARDSVKHASNVTNTTNQNNAHAMTVEADDAEIDDFLSSIDS